MCAACTMAQSMKDGSFDRTHIRAILKREGLVGRDLRLGNDTGSDTGMWPGCAMHEKRMAQENVSRATRCKGSGTIEYRAGQLIHNVGEEDTLLPVRGQHAWDIQVRADNYFGGSVIVTHVCEEEQR